MSSISAVSTAYVPVQRNTANVDADGDHDGSKPGEIEATQAQPASPPVPPKPTATAGNHINTYA